MQKLDKQSLLKLRKSLPVDGVKRIKEYLNHEFSIRYIQAVLQGTRQQDEIVIAAIAIAKEEKDKKKFLKKQIQELVSE